MDAWFDQRIHMYIHMCRRVLTPARDGGGGLVLAATRAGAVVGVAGAGHAWQSVWTVRPGSAGPNQSEFDPSPRSIDPRRPPCVGVHVPRSTNRCRRTNSRSSDRVEHQAQSNDAGAWLCPPWFDRQPRRSITQNVPAPSDPSNFNITHDRARRADRQSARPAVLDRVRTHRQQAG